MILVYTKGQNQLIIPPFTDRLIRKDAYRYNDEISIKFDTVKTLKTYYNSNGRDILIMVCVPPVQFKEINIEEEYGIKYLLCVPWIIEKCKSLLAGHEAIDIDTNNILKPHPINHETTVAIDFLKSTSFPNSGFYHPLDEERLKYVSNILSKMKINIEEDAIIKYCHDIGIFYGSAYKIIEYFNKAKNVHFRTTCTYALDF
jgi:hypothetical protein